ncbi:uncharacterized protein LOC18426240 isoform X2 [Amborella trichopoda]|uniref:uncharacterized protein LOC18426240 isoform X2 n=1 Tax=Amborella trichopoda TaxID=13333 RepID=UPI0005D39BA4|nr:uncharacterized protein LOC18426240 isoform X2 [Amborella trichopoda]|eukprot:XP_011620425.1 uncharacterized protein LOC18426240 isoform X2 [Amborella trichopoda]
MEVNGTLVPRPSVFPSRLGHQVSVKRERCFCFCVLRVLPVGDTLSTSSHHRWRKVEVQCQDSSQSVQQSLIPQRDDVGSSQLSFDRLQPREEDFTSEQKRGFGRFVVREAVLDEEYWTAAWLRAESCWENHSYMRHVESYKRKFAEQEFNALKQRCAGQFKNSLKCFCIVAVKKEEENVRRTVLNSIVGTLDVSIRQFLQGEAFPGIREKGYGKSSALMASNGSDHPHRHDADLCSRECR